MEVFSFMVGGIQQSQNFNDGIDGRNRLFSGSEDKYRKITLNVKTDAYDIHDISHLRNAINELFDGEYYIREKRIKSIEIKYETPGQKTGNMDLGKSEYVNGQQFKVAKVNAIEADDLLQMNFTVELETADLPYAETIYTTLELHDSGYTSEAGKYGLVDNIDDEKVKYRFTESTFSVYNAGNVTVEPESMDLTIQISSATSSGNLTLKNLTTGEEFKLNKNISERHISLNGMNILDGTVNTLRDTNRRFISIAPGDNDFEITGATFSEVWFRFKYYYK